MDTCSDKPSTAKTLRTAVIYVLLFLLGDFGSALVFDQLFRLITPPSSELCHLLRALGCLALTVFLFRWYTVKVLHRTMKDFGIDASGKPWGAATALALPVFVVGCFAPFAQVSVRPFSAGEIFLIVLSSLAAALKAGIAEEMLFRGFIMRLIERRWNRTAAILAPSLLFSLVHLPSMDTFSIGGVLLLLVSGTLVGVMFSLLAYRGDSIANSALVHAAWNFTMITDILHITTAEGAYHQPIFSFILPSGSLLLTGGGFGMEASGIAILGYALVCGAILLRKKR